MLGDDVGHALAVVRAGGLVAIPTETVYGLAADATNPDAVRRVFAVKGRPTDHPLIVHVAAATCVADGWASTVSPVAARLADACWPGPLTLLMPRGPKVIDEVTGGRPTVGLRVPAHPLTLALLEAFDGGLAAPSANRFGRVSPTTAAHVAADLGDDVDYILDGGPCPVGVESTIVDCTVAPPQILRPGAISIEDITALLGTVPGDVDGPARAAGMLATHYAPRATVVLVDDAAESVAFPGAAVIDYGDDLVAYARNLYADFRAADDAGAATVVAVRPPPHGLGHAIRDRLAKAAATP